MFEDLKGKKLLILGCTTDDCQIVEAAKAMGIYTITTDNHTDWDDAPAKKLSDEAWNISWADIEILKDKALAAHVDGVMAGYSEFRTKCAIQLSKALGTHFYIEDEDQLKVTRDKLLFKSMCRECNVPVAKDFYVTSEMKEEDINAIEYPVIVKPADNAGSRGITFCDSKENIKKSLEYALSFSETKRVVVEEVLKGHEIVAYYTIADGKAAFSSIFDKYARIEREGFNALMDAYVYPSNRINTFLEKHDADVKRFIEKVGLKNGVISLQGFAQPDGSIVFFELGFRLGGTSAFHYTNYFNKVSHMNMMISHSLTGNMHSEELSKEDATFKENYGCTFTLLSKDGIINKQTGEEEVKKLPNVIHTCFYHKVGTEIINNGSQFSKTFRAYIVGKSLEEIRDTIKIIQKTIVVLDKNGNNMLYDEFNPDCITKEY